MARESKRARRERTEEILRRLAVAYPDSRCSLDHANPFELAVATALSAQCTDARVNATTPELFRRFPTPEALANARQEDVEALIRTTGDIIALSPPLIVEKEHIDQIVDTVRSVLEEID